MSNIVALTTDQLIGIALSHHRAGRLADAEGIYRQLLSKDKNHAVVLDYFGVLAIQTGRLDLAASLLRRSIASDPSHPNAHCNLGQCLRQLGEYEEAIRSFTEAIRLQPDLCVAHNNLGTAYSETRQFDDAVRAFRKAIELDPSYAAAHGNLANALKDLRRLDEAMAEIQIALQLQPDVAESHNTLGVILAEAGDTSGALAAYRKAIALNPHYAEAYSNMGNALAMEGRYDEAAAASTRAVDLDPRNVQSHWNLAVMLLRNGDYSRGWVEYEWRWVTQKHFPRPSPRFYPPRFPTPHWTGGDIAGQTILLHAEQGFGDTLHFCRYAPILAARGARVILEVQPALHRLLSSLHGVDRVMQRGEEVPPFDHHCPMMSLPFALGTTVDTIPGNTPYLFPDAELVGKWKANLDNAETRLRIGLCWAGSPEHSDDAERSMALSQLAPLGAIRRVGVPAHREAPAVGYPHPASSPGIEFHSLQKGPARDQMAASSLGIDLIDHADALTDFAETAALIANLDLVITVDTAVAHVAGAIGKPVWVLIRKLADWRWLNDRQDTPWYPTMRLFRQTRRGDWDEVIQRVATALSTFGPDPGE